MNIGKMAELNRRAFLRRSACLAAVSSASSFALGLVAAGEAAAFTSGGGYKALVCVFLNGGNDHANTLIPIDNPNYSRYASIRKGVAIAQNKLAATTLSQPSDQVLTDYIEYALAPTMPRLKSLFDQGRMAPILNVGPLIVPLTRAQYQSSNTASYPRPPKLFSHNDQQSTWQSFSPEGAPSGWGGRLGDLAMSSNANSMFTTINATGNAVFLSGEKVAPFKVSPDGALTMPSIETGRLFGSAAAGEALRTLIGNHHSHVFEQDYAQMVHRSIEYNAFVNEALAGAKLSTSFSPVNPLAIQLEIVAKLIASRQNLSVNRQIFMVSLGGFDNHTGLVGKHEGQLGLVDGAIGSFQAAMDELGTADQVTTFTASDFGRTLAINGDGTDHGWGGHHFVIGGAVEGGRFFGTAPHISVQTDDQVGRGRLLPSTSVDQYVSTLALWFGVAPSELHLIAPNIGSFAGYDLGFMTSDREKSIA